MSLTPSRVHPAPRQRAPRPLPLRSDELPAGTALGYLPIAGRSRTNVFHLPVSGSGDGGIYSTAADISALWQSLFTGRIVPARWVAEMVRPRSDVPAKSKRYGLGFWLGQHSDALILEGFDALRYRIPCAGR